MPQLLGAEGREQNTSGRSRKQVRLEPGTKEVLLQLSQQHGTTVNAEINKAIKQYIQRETAGSEDLLMAPVVERLLDEKNDQVETWLRPAVWGGATYSATASLMLLELLCGQRIDPKDAKNHFQLIRGRAWKMVRSQTPDDGGG